MTLRPVCPPRAIRMAMAAALLAVAAQAQAMTVSYQCTGRRVLIIDDVITDGASKREAADLIRAVGAEPVGVAITMDRQERARDVGEDRRSGVQYVEQTLGLKVIAIATLADLMQLLATTGDPALAASKDAVAAYRARYGIDA